MGKSCGKMKCPNCGYEMYRTPEFKLLKALKAFFTGDSGRKTQDQDDTVDMGSTLKHNVPLTFLKTNQTARISEIKTDDRLKLRKLTALGIMPGFDIMVLQKYPAVVVQVGFTQVALDKDIASEIIVAKD